MSETKTKKHYLVIRQINDRKEIHRIDVTGKSERSIERVEMGILRQLRDDCFVDELKE